MTQKTDEEKKQHFKDYNKKWRSENWSKVRYNNFTGNAKKRNLTNEITKEEFDYFLSMTCYYCDEKACGLDRIDNSQGYKKGNVLSCCMRCNHTRNTYWTVEETRKMIRMILKDREEDKKKGS